MTSYYFPVRIARVLKAAGIRNQSQIYLRAAELEALGLSASDAALVRRRVGWIPIAPVLDAPAPSAFSPARALANTAELWTTRQVADYFQINRRTVANWCGSGKLAAIKLGDDWRIPRAEVQRLAVGGVLDVV